MAPRAGSPALSSQSLTLDWSSQHSVHPRAAPAFPSPLVSCVARLLAGPGLTDAEVRHVPVPDEPAEGADLLEPLELAEPLHCEAVGRFKLLLFAFLRCIGVSIVGLVRDRLAPVLGESRETSTADRTARGGT